MHGDGAAMVCTGSPGVLHAPQVARETVVARPQVVRGEAAAMLFVNRGAVSRWRGHQRLQWKLDDLMK